MCEANDSLASSRIWPPADGSGENYDEMWDDCELLAKYAQVEMQVKAQVEAFRSGKTSLPPPPPPPQSSATSNTASSRKKRRHHNKNKRKGGSGTGNFNGSQDNEDNHLCSQCSHSGEAKQWTSSTAPITSESVAAVSPAAASATAVPNSHPPQSYIANTSSFPVAATSNVAGSGVAPVYSWLLPNLDLHPELLPPPPPPPLSVPRCSCSHHHFLLPTPSDTSVTSGPGAPVTSVPFTPPSLSSLTLTTPNGEISTAVLLRAWYEAGYAMGQAHAEQILGLRSPAIKDPIDPGDGDDGSVDNDDDADGAEEENEQSEESTKSK